MIVNTNELGLAGTSLCGKTLAPCDEDSVYAIYALENCACGVTVEAGNGHPYLRLTPSLQIPPAMCQGFARAMFEAEGEDLDDLELDERDGEITLRVRVRSLDVDELETAAAKALAWVDRVGYPAAAAYVADAIALDSPMAICA